MLAERPDQLRRRAEELRRLADELEARAGRPRDAGRRQDAGAGAVRPGAGRGDEPDDGADDGADGSAGDREDGPEDCPRGPGPATSPDAAAPAAQDPGRDRADVDVRVLGGLTVTLASGHPAVWRGTQARTLLGYLVVHERPVHREVLMELLWPGLRPDSARGNLNVCVYALRRALGGGSPGAVLYRDGYYGLNPQVGWAVDRARFLRHVDRAAQAVAAGRAPDALAAGRRAAQEYAGPLLAGEPGCDWCAAERIRLHDLFLHVLESVADLCLRTGDVDGAVVTLGRAHAEDPYRESVHRALMDCYARRGQRDLVVRQFKRCVQLLDEMLDVAPSPQTTELFGRLTAG